MYALGVLVELCTACPACDHLGFGNLQNELLGDETDPVTFCERDAWLEQQVDRQCALVERGQERARQRDHRCDGNKHGDKHC